MLHPFANEQSIGSHNNKEEKSQQSRKYDKSNVAEAALFK